MIDKQTIARIIDTANILEVVEDFVALKKRGANWWGVCPFHNEKTPSFSVSPSKGIFKCFGCGKGGNAVNFVMEHEKLSYGEALRYLAQKYHIEIEEREETDEEREAERERETLFAANEFGMRHFEGMLRNHCDGQALAQTYLNERGFSEAIIKKFHIGYAIDDWSNLTNAVKQAGHKLEHFERAGLCKHHDEKGTTYDFFRGRVMFPWLTLSGKVIAFSGRVLARETKSVSLKYVNTGETPIFIKNNAIFGIFQAKHAITRADNVFMVEGQTDVISMHQCGIENVVACSGGNGLSESQAHILHRFTNNITLMYDCDEAGEKDTDGAIVAALNEGLHVSVVRLPEGEDPDSFSRKHNANEFLDYIEQHRTDFVTYICNKILQKTKNNPVLRAEMINEELVTALALVRDNILLTEYLKIAAKKLKLNGSVLANAIKQKRRKENEREAAREGAKNPAPNNADMPPPPIPDDEPPKSNPQLFDKTDTRFETLERDILQFALRHGNEQLATDENGRVWTSNELIVNQLIETDEIRLQNPLHQTMLYELQAHMHDDGFDAAHFFSTHIDTNISRLTADLLMDQYTVSRIFTAKVPENPKSIKKNEEDRLRTLFNTLQQLLLEYKMMVINTLIKTKTAELQATQTDNNQEQFLQIFGEIKHLNSIKRVISEQINRTI